MLRIIRIIHLVHITVVQTFTAIITIQLIHYGKSVQIRSFFCHALRKKYPYLEFFWPVFCRILHISPYLVKCEKIRTRKTPNIGTFHAVIVKNTKQSDTHSIYLAAARRTLIALKILCYKLEYLRLILPLELETYIVRFGLLRGFY